MTFKNFKAGGDNDNTSFKGTVCKISPEMSLNCKLQSDEFCILTPIQFNLIKFSVIFIAPNHNSSLYCKVKGLQ